MAEHADLTQAFLSRWSGAGGSELANYQLFLTELTELLDLPRPEPAGAEARDNAYVFERGITFRHGDGSTSAGRIDLYRRGAFVCECKRIRASAAKGFDDALLRARSQAVPCVFHASRSPIPVHAGHRFQRKPASGPRAVGSSDVSGGVVNRLCWA